MKSILSIFLCAGILFLLSGCKPRTKSSLSDEHIRWAITAKVMDDSMKYYFLQGMQPNEREKFTIALKKYEHLTGTVEYKNRIFNQPVDIVATLEDGILLKQIARFKNNTIAMEYYNIHNDVFKDSTLIYYTNGRLRSRNINAIDRTKQLLEQYYESGAIRSRNTDTSFITWFESGVQSGSYVYVNSQVFKRILWHPNGKKKEESEWSNDRLNGLYKEWDSLGNQKRKEFYVAGILKK